MDWAAENLQVIRTLMERASVYRRALAPVMLATGLIGVVAAAIPCWIKVEEVQIFLLYWFGVAAVAMGFAFFLVRREALKHSEPFWSPPTRRVMQAFLPGLTVGLLAGISLMIQKELWLIPPSWVLLYGTALHAAGFFMPRGMKLFGWAFIILGGGVLLWLQHSPQYQTAQVGHYVMGTFFGLFQVFYGVYLFFTEKRKNDT